MRVLALIAVSAAAWAGCTPDFAAPSQVTDLRVLAVQTDPPEAQYDATSVERVRIRVLAVDPMQRGPIEVRARACFPTDSLRCNNGPTFDLGVASPDFLVAIPRSVVEAAIGADDLRGLNGVRVQLEITVADGDPHGPVTASKLAVYSPTGTVPNHLPGIAAVDLSSAGQPAGTLAPGGTLQLRVGEEIGLRPVLTAGSREEYTTTDLRGAQVTLTEQPHWSFFAEGGAELDRDVADEPLDGAAPPDGLTRISAPRSGSGRFWIVVRDGRGGESWIEQRWSAD